MKEPWYKEGLRFECTGCGKCCTGAPGYVWVTEEEIAAIASHLNISLETFAKNYLRSSNGRLSLIETKPHFDCIFLKDKKCSIYSVRPTQCRTFPWWQQNLASPEDWQAAADRCEGIQPNAPNYTLEEISKLFK